MMQYFPVKFFVNKYFHCGDVDEIVVSRFLSRKTKKKSAELLCINIRWAEEIQTEIKLKPGKLYHTLPKVNFPNHKVSNPISKM